MFDIVFLKGKGHQRLAVRDQDPQINRSEGYQPSVFNFSDAHQFAYQGFADVDQLAQPFYLAVGAYPSNLCQRRILDISKLPGVGPRRELINAGWWYLSERLMRSFTVINMPEFMASCLLHGRVVSRWFHGFLLERTVQSLVPAVFFRMSQRDAFWFDSQLHPPYRQWGKPTSSNRGKGSAVIGADGHRQAVILKNSFKYSAGMSVIRLHDNITAKKHTAIGIADGERVTALAVLGPKPTFEIRTPYLVGLVSGLKWLCPRRGMRSFLMVAYQSVFAQYSTAGTDGRPLPGYFRRFVSRQKFGWSPGRMSFFGFKDRRDNFPRCRLRAYVWPTRTLIQPGKSVHNVPSQPFMGGFAAHLKLSSQFSHGVFSRLQQRYQFQFLFHRTGFFPRQGSSPPCLFINLLPMCLANV